MKRFFSTALSAIILLFAGCSEDYVNNDMNNPESESVNPTTRVVSSDEARAFADKAVVAILSKSESPATRSADSRSIMRSAKEVLPIKTSDGETALYAVNFNDGAGFMILSADKEASSSMLAFSDSCSFNLNTLTENSPMGEWLREQRDAVALELKKGIIDKGRENYQIWEYLGDSNDDTEIEMELVNFPEAEGVQIPTTRGSHENSWGLTEVSPSYWITAYTWGQGTGYNADAPRPNVDLVGCPAVAAGLLCNYWGFPSDFPYYYMPTQLPNNTTSSNVISQMFRDIADLMPGYSWGTAAQGGSGCGGQGILTGLKSLGYDNAVYANYNFNTVYNDIKNRRPVLLGGQSGYGGHIWIADGYWEQTEIYQKVSGYYYKDLVRVL